MEVETSAGNGRVRFSDRFIVVIVLQYKNEAVLYQTLADSLAPPN